MTVRAPCANTPFAAKLADELNRLLATRGLEASIRRAPREQEGVVIDIEMRVTGPLADKLIAAGAEWSRPPLELAAAALEAVIKDNLWNAVLDER